MPGDRKEHPKMGAEADTELSEMPLSSLDGSYQYLLLETRREFPEALLGARCFLTQEKWTLYKLESSAWHPEMCVPSWSCTEERCQSGKQTQ